MKLSRLSDRQLKRLLARGEVRFGGYDSRPVSEYYRWTEKEKAQFERRIKDTLKYIVEITGEMDIDRKQMYKEQIALSNALRASLAAWEALDRKIYALDDKRKKELG